MAEAALKSSPALAGDEHLQHCSLNLMTINDLIDEQEVSPLGRIIALSRGYCCKIKNCFKSKAHTIPIYMYTWYSKVCFFIFLA